MEPHKLPNAPVPSTQKDLKQDYLEVGEKSKTGIETLLTNEHGLIVGRLNNELLRYKTDAHVLTVSPTGGGKTTGAIIPNLLDHPGSALVIDIRGETVAKTANSKRLQGHQVIVLDPYNITNYEWGRDTYNPLDRLISHTDNLTSDDRIQRLVSALMFDPSGRMSNEPIWDNATKNLLSGLIAYCIRYCPSYRHSLIEVLDILNYTPKELENFIAEILVLIETNEEAKSDRQLKSLVKILTEGKSTTKVTDNAIIQAQTLLTWVGNRSFKDMLDVSTFTFDDLQDTKKTIYIVIPEEFIDNCASWTRIIIESAIFSTKDVYSSKGISTDALKQEDRILFLLDELPAFGQLDVISKGMATLRGRGVNLWLFVQNLAQLDDVYGEKKARTIIGNASAIQVFKSVEVEELEYFSKLIGEEFYDVQTVSIGDSNTEGTSDSSGTSITLSNSVSVSNTTGTGDSISESTSSNWNRSLSNTTNKSRSTNKSFSHGDGINSSSSKGWNSGKTGNYERNLLASNRVGMNNSRGLSANSSKGRSANRNWSEGESFTEGESTGNTISEGHSESKSKTQSTNKSETHSEQKGESHTSSETHSTNQSSTVSRNISVKQERMKVETIRSLRNKMSDRNQLLVIRDHHPFFTPKMSYFAKYTDTTNYIFPQIISCTSIAQSKEIIVRLKELIESTSPENVDKQMLELLENTKSISHSKDEIEQFAEDGFIHEALDWEVLRDHYSKDIKRVEEAYIRAVKFGQGFIATFQNIIDLITSITAHNKIIGKDKNKMIINTLHEYSIFIKSFISNNIMETTPLFDTMKSVEILTLEYLDLCVCEIFENSNLARCIELPIKDYIVNESITQFDFKKSKSPFGKEEAYWMILTYSYLANSIYEQCVNEAALSKRKVETKQQLLRILDDILSNIDSVYDESIAEATAIELAARNDFWLNRHAIT